MVKGQLYGRYKEYYSNGKVESIRFKKDDKEIGEITWFRPDGSLDTYNFYDDLGSVNFVSKYDKTNKVIKGEGLVLFEIYQHKLRKKVKQVTYKLGDPVRYQFMFPNIPNTTRKFEYELLDYDNSKIDRKETKIEPFTLDVTKKAAKKGENTIEARIRYEFNDKTHNVLADTIRFTYYVE